MESGFTFCSFWMRVMGAVAPFMFKMQNNKFLKAFKAFCETGADVRDK